MTTGTSSPQGPDVQLAAAVQGLREAESLDQRIAAALDRAKVSAGAARQASSLLEAEDRDVAKLETLSWSRVLSTLRGAHTTDHDRERAEADAARYSAGVALARSQADRHEVRSLQAQRAALGDVTLAHEEALAAKEAWLRTHGVAESARLEAIAVERGTLGAEETESREAHDAGVTAHGHLSRAASTLDSARSWSSWDTFGGGGLFTDMMKYDRLDEVGRELRQAEAALRAFTDELADVHLPAAAALDIDSLTSTFDVWFDNIFTDWAVRDRIIDAQGKVAHAVTEVGATLDRIRERRTAIATRLAELSSERTALLGG